MSKIILNPYKIDKYYFPVSLEQVEVLLGKMLTHVEAMGLNSSAEKANKDLVRQSIWKWWDDAQENSLSSWKGCIGPILAESHTSPVASNHMGDYIWLTEVGRVAEEKELNQNLKEKNNIK
jgi:hypothetical protein